MFKRMIQRMAKDMAIEIALLWAVENQRKIGKKDEKNVKELIALLLQALAFTGRTDLTADEVQVFLEKL